MGLATITFDRPHGFGAVKYRNSISVAGANLTNGTFHGIKLFNSDGSTWDGARASVVIAGGQVGVVTITEGGSGYTAETLVVDRQFIGGGSATAAQITVTNVHGSSGISTNIGDSVQLTGIGTATDGLYRIATIPSTTQISVALTATSPRPQIDQYAINVGPSAEIASESFSVDTTTFTTVLGHGLISGQKFKVLDANNQDLGSFLVKTKVSATSFTAVTTVDLGTPKFILPDGVASATPLSDKENENVGSRGLSFYDGDYFFLGANATNSTTITVSLPNSGNNDAAAIRSRFPIGSYLQAGDEIMRVKSTTVSGSSQIQVIRSALGTPQQNHLSGDIVRKIKPKAIELRRPSIIRASGHTFEYLGFGPGNYSTALPQVQVRTLSEREEFLVQSQERSCGTVVYTGMNNRGDFFIGNKRVSSATGQERTFDAPIATVTGEDPSRLSVIFDEVIIKERLVVEGGKSNTILTQFDGPVTFNKLVKVNEDLTVNGIMKLNNTFEITNTTQSNNKDTGAFVVEGGIGIEKNLNVGEMFKVSGVSTVGSLGVTTNFTVSGISTFTGEVNFSGGIDVGNIDIAISDDNTITTDTGDLVLDANGSSVVQVNTNLSVDGNIAGNFLDIDNVNINGNTITTQSGDLVLDANGSSKVDIQATAEVDALKFNSASEVYTSVDTDLSSVSSSHDTLVSAKAVKTSLDALDTTLTISADSGSNDNVTVGTDTLNFAGTTNEVNTTVSNNQIQIGLPNNVTVSGNLTVNGNTDLGNATSDTITATGRFDSALVPSADDTHDLGTNDNKWQDLYIDGIAYVDDIHAADCNIDGGEIDGVTIGTNSAVTDLRVDNVQINGNTVTTTSGDLTLEAAGGDIIINDNVDLNGTLDLDGSFTADNVRINGNKIDTTSGKLELDSDNNEVEINANIDHNGDLNTSGSITGNSGSFANDVVAFTSDIRLKTDIEPIQNALDKVQSLNGFTYKHNEIAGELGLNTETRYAGISAQDLQEVLPEAVKNAPASDKYLTVQYEKVVPLLIEAIKELKTEIEELKK